MSQSDQMLLGFNIGLIFGYLRSSVEAPEWIKKAMESIEPKSSITSEESSESLQEDEQAEQEEDAQEEVNSEDAPQDKIYQEFKSLHSENPSMGAQDIADRLGIKVTRVYTLRVRMKREIKRTEESQAA